MKVLLQFALMAVLTIGSSVVFAQPAGGSAPQGQNVKITKSDRKKFNKVQPKVRDLNVELREKLGGVNDTQKARSLQAKYREKMIKEVKDSGLTIDKYNAMIGGPQN